MALDSRYLISYLPPEINITFEQNLNWSEDETHLFLILRAVIYPHCGGQKIKTSEVRSDKNFRASPT